METPLKAYISVGSNIEPERNIEKALELLKKHTRILDTSTFYRSKALRKEKEKEYLNGVWCIQTEKEAEELKSGVLKKIEDSCERIRTRDKYASRTLDLDLILYGDQIIQKAGLHIPDPDIYERSFIAFPLFELDPDMILPDTGTKITAITQNLSQKDIRPEQAFTERLKRRIRE